MAEHQIEICRDLQLLQLLNYSGLNSKDLAERVYYSNKQWRTAEENAEVRLLDTIAVCLWTNDVDVVATSFHTTPEAITLYVVKNDTVTLEDPIRNFADTFLQLMSRKETKSEQVLQALIDGNARIIHKRIRSLFQFISNLQSKFNKELKNYAMSANIKPETEFDKDYKLDDIYKAVQFSRKNDKPGVQTTDLLGALRDTIGTRGREINNVAKPSIKDLQELDGLCTLLLRSAFMRSTTSDEFERLKRRLNKVCQVIGDVEVLFNTIQKQTSGGKKIKVEWVPNPNPGESKKSVNVGELEAAIRAAVPIGEDKTISGIVKTKGNRWQTTIVPRMHAEVRMAVYRLTTHGATGGSRYAIGVSKRSCLTCWLWLEELSKQTKTVCWTSGSHGNPYPAWVLPVREPKSVGEALWKNIHQRAKNLIEGEGKGDKGYFSEDNRSSGSGDELDPHKRYLVATRK